MPIFSPFMISFLRSLRFRQHFIQICFVLLIVLAIHTPAQSQEIKEPPVNFSANEMDFDKNLGIITARGDVEVTQNQRTLIADTISYNQRLDILTASGNITLLEPSGDVLFAEHLEMTGDFKNGIIANIRMILSDNSRLAANGGRRINGNLDLRKAVYTPCKACEEDPTNPPLWQIKAVKIYHDNTRHVIEYSDAWLEVAGVPILYTPYLTHPDPTVKRESGFLAPTYISSTELGFGLKTPYFINISEQTDMTVTPTVYSDQGGGFIAEYRDYPIDGELFIETSLMAEDTNEKNGHLKSLGRFNIDQSWRWGFDGNYTSDDTYLRRYEFSSPQTLTSNLFAEGFRERNYMRADALYFQGLKATDDQGTIPIVAPFITFNHKGSPDNYGGQTTFDANFVSLSREDGVNLNRVSLRPGWEANYVSTFGEAYKLSLNLDTDLYHISNYTPDSMGEFTGFTGRIVPQAKLDWRLPMVKQSDTVHQLFEPTASLVISPNNVNPVKIANEDSQEFEFDETSLFRRNRFTGEDRLEGGTHIDYGIQWGVYNEEGGKASAFVGQSYRLHKDNTFADNSGLENNLSDYVAKIEVSPNSYFDLLYRTRIGKTSGDIKRNEISFKAGVPLFNVSSQYQFFEKQVDSEFNGREDLNVTIESQFNKFWRGSIDMQHDIEDEQTRRLGSALIYEDECLNFTTNFARSFYKDRDLKPVDTFMFNITFKTLGEFRSF